MWTLALNEGDVWLKWLAEYLSDEGTRLTTLGDFIAKDALTPAALTRFRTVATQHHVDVPTDSDTEASLRRMLRLVVAGAKWGERGALTLRARWDQ